VAEVNDEDVSFAQRSSRIYNKVSFALSATPSHSLAQEGGVLSHHRWVGRRWKDRAFSLHPPRSSLSRILQTLLEKIKTLYNDKPGLTPDKIGPTVGQNSASLLQLVEFLSPFESQWGK
jgi:hypothetical protein